MVTIRSRHLLPVALCLVLAGAAGCGQSSNSKPAPEREAATAAKVITYGKDGVVLRKSSDVRKLTGAPDDFKQYMAGVTDAAVLGVERDDDCPLRVDVQTIDPKGYAIGGISTCGGATYIWAKKQGVWQQIFGGQYAPDCDFWKAHKVPTSIAGNKCWQDTKMVPYKG